VDFFSELLFFSLNFFSFFLSTLKKEKSLKNHTSNGEISCSSLSLAVRQVRFLAPKLARACRKV